MQADGPVDSAQVRLSAESSAREESLRLCIEAAPVGLAMLDRDLRYLAASRTYRDEHGLGDQDIIGRRLYDVLPDCEARCRDIHQRCLAGATERRDADPFLRPDGSVQWHRWEIRPWHDGESRIGGIVIVREDITLQQRVLADLNSGERQVEALVQAEAASVWELDHNLRFTRGGRNNALVGLAPWEIPGLDPEAPSLKAHWADLRAHRSFRDFQFPIEEPGLGRRHFAVSGNPMHDQNGAFVGYRGVIRSVTARAQAEQALRASEAQHRSLIDSIDAGIFIAQDDRFVFCNRRFAEMLGADESDLQGAPCESVMAPHDLQLFRQQWRRIADGARPQSEEFACRHQRDASPVHLLVHADRIEHDGRAALLATVTDLGDRARVEARLGQARRMEATSRLAGAVAHSFNGLLAAILGNLELLSAELPDGPLWQRAVGALRGARRGADVAHRLLAFGRRQPLRPEDIDLNDLVSALRSMLRQTVGEAVTVEMTLAPNLPRVYADRIQLEAALLELVANARAAMPRGGRIIIQTARASAGNSRDRDGAIAPDPRVVLAVADTGTGMTPFVKEHACDPFFTTAEAAMGLGLSMVYGFALQSGGAFALDSEAGLGTTVRLYLPPARMASRR